MTVALRDTILFIGISIALLMLLFTLGFTALFIFMPGDIFLPLLEEAGFNRGEFFSFLVKIVLFSASSVGLAIFFRRHFRRSVLGESFFFTIFLVTLSLEALVLLQWLVLYLDKSPYFYTIVTRGVITSRMFGVFSLFASGLFVTGIQYKKFGLYSGLGVLLALIVTSSLAVDSTEFGPDFLNRIGSRMEFTVAMWVIQGFGVLNFIWAGFSLNNKDYSFMGVGLFFIILGKELLFHYTAPLFLSIGFVLLLFGVVLFGNRLKALYLWF